MHHHHHDHHHSDDVDLFHGRHMEARSAEPTREHIDPLSEKGGVILNSDELFKKALVVRDKMLLMHKYVRARCWLERRRGANRREWPVSVVVWDTHGLGC